MYCTIMSDKDRCSADLCDIWSTNILIGSFVVHVIMHGSQMATDISLILRYHDRHSTYVHYNHGSDRKKTSQTLSPRTPSHAFSSTRLPPFFHLSLNTPWFGDFYDLLFALFAALSAIALSSRFACVAARNTSTCLIIAKTPSKSRLAILSTSLVASSSDLIILTCLAVRVTGVGGGPFACLFSLTRCCDSSASDN